MPCWWNPWRAFLWRSQWNQIYCALWPRKCILFGKVGFIDALEMRGAIPYTNVIHSASALRKPETSPSQETCRAHGNIPPPLSSEVLGQQSAWHQSQDYGMETSTKMEEHLERAWHSKNFSMKSEKLNSDVGRLPFGDLDYSCIPIQRVQARCLSVFSAVFGNIYSSMNRINCKTQ